MRKGSLIERYSYLVHLSVILTQVVRQEQGFRLRDVKFYCNLVSNWISFDGQGYDFDIELMQIKRLMEHFIGQSWAQMVGTRDQKRFQLTHQGFIGILEGFRRQTSLASMEEVLLLTYAFKCYQPFLEQYLLRSSLSEAEKVHIQSLVDPDWFIENYLEHMKKRLRGIQKRIDENNEMTSFIHASQEAGQSFSSIVEEVHRRFSYQLSYAKTFRELLHEIPEELGRFELTQGLESRNRSLFIPLRDIYEQRRAYLTSHLKALDRVPHKAPNSQC